MPVRRDAPTAAVAAPAPRAGRRPPGTAARSWCSSLEVGLVVEVAVGQPADHLVHQRRAAPMSTTTPSASSSSARKVGVDDEGRAVQAAAPGRRPRRVGCGRSSSMVADRHAEGHLGSLSSLSASPALLQSIVWHRRRRWPRRAAPSPRAGRRTTTILRPAARRRRVARAPARARAGPGWSASPGDAGATVPTWLARSVSRREWKAPPSGSGHLAVAVPAQREHGRPRRGAGRATSCSPAPRARWRAPRGPARRRRPAARRTGRRAGRPRPPGCGRCRPVRRRCTGTGASSRATQHPTIPAPTTVTRSPSSGGASHSALTAVSTVPASTARRAGTSSGTGTTASAGTT